MARRRLNTRLFAALLIGVVVCGIAAIVAVRILKGGKDPRVLEQQGDAAFAAGRYDQARIAYGTAATIERSNPRLKVKYGDALIKLTQDDVVNLSLALHSWQDALANDPSYKDALERLLNSRWEQVELGAGSEVFADIRRQAEQLAKVDPSHPKAAIWRHIATVRQALGTLPVPQEELEESVTALQALAEKNPADAEVPYYLASLKVKEAIDLRAAQSSLEANVACDDALAIIDGAVKGQDKNAQMQYRAATVLWQLGRVDPRAAERKYDERAGKCVLAALELIKPGEANYDEVIRAASDQLVQDGKTDDAIALRRKYYEQNKDNQLARLSWAGVLAAKPETRAQAITLLSQEVPLPPDAVGVGVVRHREQQARTLYSLIKLRAADAAATQDATKRKELFAQVDTDMDRLRRLANPRAVPVLALEGIVLSQKGQKVEAIKAMKDAYDAMAGGAKDWELVFGLARAYNESGQSGSARQLCEELVEAGSSSPYILPARSLLADLLLRENRVQAAVEQIKLLSEKDPKHPDLPRLNTTLLLKTRQFDKVFAGMGEKSNAERWEKLKLASAAQNQEEQIRLLQAIIASDAADLNAFRLLATVYRSGKQNDRALEVVNAGLKVKPDDSMLRLFKAELEGVAPEELRKRAIAEIQNSIPDAYERELKLYDLEKMSGSRDVALKHLQAASAARPGDPKVTDLMFREALDRRQFAEARSYLPKLVDLDLDQVGGRLYRHRLALVEQDYAEAERVAADLVAKYPEFANSWMALGEAQEALGKWADAIQSFSQVLARVPMHYSATRALIDTYYNAGRTDDAKVRLKELHDNFPDDATVRELYLSHLANFGEPQLAVPDREKLLKERENDPWAYLSLAATYFKNAQRLSAENKLDESRAEIDKAFQTLSRGQRKFPDDTRFYAQVAEIRQYNGQLDQAEQVLKDFARRENMKDATAKIRPDPWLALAEFYKRIGKHEEAVSALADALVRSENNLEVRLELASAQMRARKFTDAEATISAVANNPDPRVARKRLELLIAQQKTAEAEQAIRQSLQLRDGPDLRNLLASVLIDTGRVDDAIVECNRSLAIDAKNEAARYLRAMAYARKTPPDNDTAINELVDLKRSAPNNTQARLLLAELYQRTGRRSNAMQDLAEGLEKVPGDRDLRLALIRMYRDERPPRFQDAYKLIATAGNDPVLKMDPVWPREAAGLFAQQRNFQQAVIAMTRAVQLAPGNVDYRRELVDMLLQFNDLAGALIQTDKLLHDGVDGIWLRFQRGLAIGRQLNARLMADAKKDPAVAAKVSEIRAQALAEFDHAIKLSDQAGDAARMEGILRTMGETVGNDHALTRVGPRTANDPTNRWRLLAIGLKRANGDYAGAVADAERMLQDPSNGPGDAERRGPLLRALADTYQNQPQPNYQKARQYYTELLTLVPDDLAALNNLAYLLSESLQPPEPQAAVEYSERAYNVTRVSPNPNPLILDTHGWVLILAGGKGAEDGRRILQKVVTENPYFIEGRYHLGEALLKVAPTSAAQAEKEFSECLRLMNEEEKLGGKINEKLRNRIQSALANARELAKGG